MERGGDSDTSSGSDPRFQRVSKHKAKVEIDSRFSRAFSDKSFSTSAAPLDKRGKPKKQKSQNPLQRYYRIKENKPKEEETLEEEEDEDEDEDEEEEENEREELGKGTMAKRAELSDESEKSESGSEDEVESADSESTTDTDEEDVYEEEEAEVQEESIPNIEKETHRLAIVNMDWRHVKAVDLYVVLSSFLPSNGRILSVAVYPSEFGLQRMKEEEVHGPVGLFDVENGQEEKDNDDDDDDEMDDEKLRAYERSRLRYYFAVVECDSSATADYLYSSCDGVEFERSSNVLDLRFIPDSMEFKHPPRDIATEAPANYDGLDFQTRALQQSKIQLTWDEDEPDRVKTLKRKFNADQLADLELKEFLASDESESDDETENKDVSDEQSDKKSKKRDRYLSLLQEGDGSDENGEDDEKQDLEVTFNTGLEDLSKRILEKKERQSETVFEAYLRKRREKKKMRKNKSKTTSDDDDISDVDQEETEQGDDFFIEEPPVKKGKKNKKTENENQEGDGGREATAAELELLVADEMGEDTGPKGYNLKRKKSKGKKKGNEKSEEDELAKIPTFDTVDSRFSAALGNPLFAMDPTDPNYKRSAAYLRQAAQRRQKDDTNLPPHDQERNEYVIAKSDMPSSTREKHELSSLVRSVKMKSKQVQLLKKEERPSNRDKKKNKGKI